VLRTSAPGKPAWQYNSHSLGLELSLGSTSAGQAPYIAAHEALHLRGTVAALGEAE